MGLVIKQGLLFSLHLAHRALFPRFLCCGGVGFGQNSAILLLMAGAWTIMAKVLSFSVDDDLDMEGLVQQAGYTNRSVSSAMPRPTTPRCCPVETWWTGRPRFG